MTLDIGRDMLVMWIRAGQVRNVRMLEGIIPTDLLIRAVDFVTVLDNPLTIKIHQLPDIKQHVSVESHLAFEFGQSRTYGRQYQCGALNDGISFWQRVDEFPRRLRNS